MREYKTRLTFKLFEKYTVVVEDIFIQNVDCGYKATLHIDEHTRFSEAYFHASRIYEWSIENDIFLIYKQGSIEGNLDMNLEEYAAKSIRDFLKNYKDLYEHLRFLNGNFLCLMKDYLTDHNTLLNTSDITYHLHTNALV